MSLFRSTLPETRTMISRAGDLEVETFLDADRQREHRLTNMQQSAILMAGMGGVLILAAWLVWGLLGAVLALVTLGAIYTFTPSIPPEAIMRLYRGRPIPVTDTSQLSSLLDVLAFRAGLQRRPALYVIPSMTLNAFAVGSPDRSAIAITEGLLRKLTLREISGVMAHEISHIRNNDLHVLGLADAVTRILQLLSYLALVLAVLNLLIALADEQVVSWWVILLLYLAPAISSLLQLALSRAREFDADLEAASLTGDALGLASALRRLETYLGHFWEDLMFPVPARRVPGPSLLRSHPPTEERIQRLLTLDSRSRHEPMTIIEEPMVSLVGFGPIEMRPRYRWPGLWF
jgi:heat shock protein HtpX